MFPHFKVKFWRLIVETKAWACTERNFKDGGSLKLHTPRECIHTQLTHPTLPPTHTCPHIVEQRTAHNHRSDVSFLQKYYLSVHVQWTSPGVVQRNNSVPLCFVLMHVTDFCMCVFAVQLSPCVCECGCGQAQSSSRQLRGNPHQLPSPRSRNRLRQEWKARLASPLLPCPQDSQHAPIHRSTSFLILKPVAPFT